MQHPHTEFAIIGISHLSQHRTLPEAERFVQLLTNENQRSQFAVILEEALHGQISSTEDFCVQHGIPYRNIEMPPEQKRQAGIPKLYGRSDPELQPDEQDPRVPRIYAIRENYMIEQIKKAIDDFAPKGLIGIVCGLDHVSALSASLKSEGFNVATVNWTNV